jgi:RNA polymerase sigma-70 factor, ECF subfamily
MSLPMEDALPRITLGRAALEFAAKNPQPGVAAENEASRPESDEQLMAAFARGSAEAFESLFSRYKQRIFGFFRRRVADPAIAEELTQECFLAVIRGAERYKPGALFRTYLYAIGLRMVQAHRRKAIFRGLFLGVAEPRHEPAVEDHTDAKLTLRQAVSKLDRMDREVLILREFEELSYAEIAGLLRLPVNTVRSRLFRARMELHELLTAPAAVEHKTAANKAEERI